MGSEIGLQGGAQYSYRPSFLLPGRWWLVKIDQSDRIQLQCGPVCLCVDTPQLFPLIQVEKRRCHFQSAPMQTAVFWHFFFWCRQLSSAVGGYIVTETWMALALKLCGYHVVVMSCSNISPLCNLQQQQQPWSVRKRQKHHIHNVMLYSRCVWTFRAIYFALKQGL